MVRIALTFVLFIAAFALSPARDAQAQSGSVYLQIEAHPTLSRGEEAAQGFAATLAGISGYRVPGGWYAVTIGPFESRAEALRQLQGLRRQNAVPADSFIVEAVRLGQRFYPAGAAPSAPALITTETAATQPEEEPVVPVEPEETLREARASERLLDRDGRVALQQALQWDGFYTSSIDGAIGPGTRRAMALWQASKGFPETGVLTTRQRAQLLGEYNAIFEALGLEQVVDAEAGIEMLLPLGLIARDSVEPPFVRFTSTSDADVEALLISQEGDQGTLFGLYDIMQTLEIVPTEGERTRRPTSFTLTGQDSTRHSYTYATLAGGAVKGFTLSWKPEDDRLMSRILDRIQDSFSPLAGSVLPDAAGTGQVQSIDLVAGLEIRRPIKSRSAFWIDGTGRVLTTTDLLDDACGRYTLDTDFPARVEARDDALGLAILAPETALAPPKLAAVRAGAPRLRSEIAVAGYSFEGRLDLPSVTFGSVEDIKGLAGEASLNRLDVETLDGDAGGPVFDMSGAVAGVLQAKVDGARSLPGNVRFAVSSDALSAFLQTAGIAPIVADITAPMAPEDLALLAADAVVLASCWR